MTPWNLAGGAFRDDTKPFSVQDCVNYIPESAENDGTRSPAILRGAPGYTQTAGPGEGTIRGIRNVEGQLFYVADNILWALQNDGSSVNLGIISGSGRVDMTHNQAGGGYQLVIDTGTNRYVYSTADATLVQVTDSGFPGSIKNDFINGMILGIEPQRRFWFHSAIADALEYNTLDRYEAESSPDRLVSILVDHLQVWVFGERTIEIWVNEPLENASFQRASGTTIQQGCAGRFTPVSLDNSIFWFGNDGIVYRADGYTPKRISTHAIEQEFSKLTPQQWSDAFAMAWSDRGHKVYYLTIGNKTWGYDVSTGLWHRRESYNRGRWNVNAMAFYNNKWIVGDWIGGLLHYMSWTDYTENGVPLIAKRTSPYIQAGQSEFSVSGIELVFNTGFGSVADHFVSLRYSDDGGYNWSNYRDRSLGTTGQYNRRTRWWRMGGRALSRSYEFTVASPSQRDLITAAIEVEGG